jgi:hypothetical protein
MKGVKRLVAAAAMAALGLGPASAACWSDRAVDAAYVRDLDTMLMTATLRCRLHGVDLAAGYNKFVREKRPVLVAANEELREHFAVDARGGAALDAFDRFATALANSHGAGDPGKNCADYQALVEAAVAAAPERAALIEMARQAGSNPTLANGRCTTQIALAR